MKLVEILAREMSEWPDDGTDVVGQSSDGTLHLNASFEHNRGFTDKSYTIADDWHSADVTRADWEAERARIKGEAKVKPKSNKDGWVRHRGGKCPVAIGDQIDVRYRNGNVEVITADADDEANEIWKHVNDYDDIMAWRPHKAEQSTTKQSLEVEIPATQDGPLQWRDRIFELDAEQSQAEEAHKAATEARDAERTELVARLKAEGLALVRAEDSHQEDMSDPANWRAGDLLLRIDENSPSVYTPGMKYPILKMENDLPAVQDNFGKGSYCWIRSDELSMFKWHSRPSN